MSRLLIVDDEPTICWGFQEFLTEEGHQVEIASTAEEALKIVNKRNFDAVVLDVRLPGMDGLSALGEIRRRTKNAPVIVITAFGDLPVAVRAISEGAFDYLPKPFDLEQAMTVVRRALSTRRSPSGETPSACQNMDEETLIGTSPAMQLVFKQIALVSRSDIPVLITGERGTGKELTARAIHTHSARGSGPFLPISIGALNPQTVEIEFFGHVKGAFPGASAPRQGLLEQAEGGTILLDEISEASPALQIKLLRAIENAEILPVGDVRPRAINVRFLSTTNRPLDELLTNQNFREDLYFRLSGFHIHLPPLRERPDDLDLMMDLILDRRRRQESSLSLSVSARQALHKRRWQGNARELRYVMEHAFLLARSGELLPEHFPDDHQLENWTGGMPKEHQIEHQIQEWIQVMMATHSHNPSEELYERFLSIVEPPFLKMAMADCEGNRALVAQRLGIHRATLRQKLRRHGLI